MGGFKRDLERGRKREKERKRERERKKEREKERERKTKIDSTNHDEIVNDQKYLFYFIFKLSVDCATNMKERKMNEPAILHAP